MSNDIPLKIWACIDSNGYNHWVDDYPVWGGSTKYIRADHPDYIHKDELRKVLEGMRKHVTGDGYYDVTATITNRVIDQILKEVCGNV